MSTLHKTLIISHFKKCIGKSHSYIFTENFMNCTFPSVRCSINLNNAAIYIQKVYFRTVKTGYFSFGLRTVHYFYAFINLNGQFCSSEIV